MNGRGHLSRYLDAWETHDADRTSELYAADAVMRDPTLSTPRRGREEIRQYFRELFQSLRDPKRELLDWAERDGRVWFEWAVSSNGVRKTGASIQTLSDGMIVDDTAYWDPYGDNPL